MSLCTEIPSKCHISHSLYCTVQVRIPKVNSSLPEEEKLVSVSWFPAEHSEAEHKRVTGATGSLWFVLPGSPCKPTSSLMLFGLSVWKHVTGRCLQAMDISLYCFSKNVHPGKLHWVELWCCLKEHQPWLCSVVSDKGSRNYSSPGEVSGSSLAQLIQAEVCLDIAVWPERLSLYYLCSFQCLVVTKKTDKRSIQWHMIERKKNVGQKKHFWRKTGDWGR